MVTGRRSTTGHPILVGGPQISYFFPGLVLEIDMHAPHNNWRGATSAPFPGYLLIGRTPRFSTTLTSASSDIIDQYAETLCGGSNEKYMYKGKCRPMGHFDAGTLNGKPVNFLTTVHGPVQGYATVRGREVAISEKRSSRGKDVLDQLYFRRLSDGQVKSPQTFFKAAALTPQTFNSFYIDNKHIAEYTSGRDPIRPASVDPGLPTKGTGGFEWRGFLKPMAHMHGQDNKQGYMTNWNNGAARGFGAADDEWMRNGSVGRVNLLNFNLKRLQKKGKWSPASITSAMNASATQDVRAIVMVPLLDRLLRGSTAPSPMAQQMLDLLNQWRQHGGNRLDLNGDGKIDYPGAAIMDAAYPNIVNNEIAARLGQTLLPQLNTLASRWDAPPGGEYDGWYQYFDRDIRGLLAKKKRLPDQLNLTYCGKGHLGLCRSESGTRFRRPATSSPPIGHRGSGRLARQRDRGADPLQPAAAAHDGVHQPAERHPAGHLLQVVKLPRATRGGSRGPPRTPSSPPGGPAFPGWPRPRRLARSRARRSGRVASKHSSQLELRSGRTEQATQRDRVVMVPSCSVLLGAFGDDQPAVGERSAELLPRVVQRLVERPAGAAEPVREHVDRHLVQSERHQDLALVRSQARLDLLPDGREQVVHLDLGLRRGAGIVGPVANPQPLAAARVPARRASGSSPPPRRGRTCRPRS